MIPPTDQTIDHRLEQDVAERVRLRIKERDESATYVEVRTRNGYIMAAVERPELMDEEGFRNYLHLIGISTHEGVIKDRKDENNNSTTIFYNGSNAFVQVSKA